MKSIIFISALFIGLVFASCGPSSEELAKTSDSQILYNKTDDLISSKEEPAAPEGNEKGIIQNDLINVKQPDKIIKTANMSIQVEEFDSSLSKIRKTVNQFQGYISNENESHCSYQIYNTLTIRIPKDKFDGLISQFEKLATVVDSKNVNMEDVTEEYVDIETRLKTKKEVETRYLEILKQSKSITDILNVENELRVIREEIEAKEGRMKFLNDQIGLSTITLYVYQKYDNPYEPGFFGKVGSAFSTGWKGLKLLFIGIIYLWPLWIILAGFFIWLRHYLRKGKKNK